MLLIDHLIKNFGSHTAVQGFSLDVKESEFVTLLGPSGSGKTTVLRMVAGLLEPSQGRIHIGGSDVTNLAPQRRNIGLVFQSYALFPNMTAWDNVAFPLRVRKWSSSDIKKRVDHLLDVVGLSHRARFYPDNMSGGERQRTALARALAFHPPLLLLDEPLSALDAKVRQGLRSSLKEIQRTTGVTTLMVTHDQEEALELSDRVVVMSDGKVEQIGTPTDIYYRPQTSFTANFIGQVNTIRCVVQSLNAGTAKLRWLTHEFTWPSGDDKWLAGDTVTIFVRPESMNILTESEVGSISARIEKLTFTGALTRATLKVGDDELMADVLSSQGATLVVGSQVFVRIAPWDHAHRDL